MGFFKWFQKPSAERAKERLEKIIPRDREETKEREGINNREKEEAKQGCCSGKVEQEIKEESQHVQEHIAKPDEEVKE